MRREREREEKRNPPPPFFLLSLSLSPHQLTSYKGVELFMVTLVFVLARPDYLDNYEKRKGTKSARKFQNMRQNGPRSQKRQLF